MYKQGIGTVLLAIIRADNIAPGPSFHRRDGDVGIGDGDVGFGAGRYVVATGDVVGEYARGELFLVKKQRVLLPVMPTDLMAVDGRELFHEINASRRPFSSASRRSRGASLRRYRLPSPAPPGNSDLPPRHLGLHENIFAIIDTEMFTECSFTWKICETCWFALRNHPNPPCVSLHER